ncbi:MAG: SUMF1/EgtB/PvdO family nonheme iron enzyme [Polyangiaceae bacterium]
MGAAGLLGAFALEARNGACPPGMALIAPAAGSAFCIDRYEGTLLEVSSDGKSSAHSPFEPVNGKKVRALSTSNVIPQGYISGVEAKLACEGSKKRLCTPDEWQTACMGKTATKYPYGDDEIPGRCNGDGTRAHPVLELFGPGMDAFGDPAKMNDPRINQLPRTLTRTGGRTGCKNTFGVFDMVGNLHEWTADASGQFRGGYYMDTHKNGDGCLYKTTAHNPSYRDYSTGFRCCK